MEPTHMSYRPPHYARGSNPQRKRGQKPASTRGSLGIIYIIVGSLCGE